LEGGDDGIELIAELPSGVKAVGGLLAKIRYAVTAADMADTVTGTMNLVGPQARGLVQGLAVGSARRFLVEVFDVNHIRTFSAVDTLDIGANVPQAVRLTLTRLTGSLE